MFIIGNIIAGSCGSSCCVLFARMILSWVPVLVRDWEPRGPMLVVAELVYSITDPPLRVLRKVLKPVRVGNMMLDLAFIGLVILVSILMQVNRASSSAEATDFRPGTFRWTCPLPEAGSEWQMCADEPN